MTYNMKTDKRRAGLRATALTAKALDLCFLFDFEHAAVDRQHRLARGDLHVRVHRTVHVSRLVVKQQKSTNDTPPSISSCNPDIPP